MLAVAAVGGAAGGWGADRIIQRVGSAVSLRGGLVVIGGAQATIGLTHSPMVLTAALAIGNAAFAVWLTAAASQRHALTPDHLLGRVTGVWRTAAMGAIAVGALCGGLLAQWFGLRVPFLAGAPLVVGAALIARALTAEGLACAHTASGPPPPSEPRDPRPSSDL